MARGRTERLLNLVFALLSTRRYLTAQEIREMVSGYDLDNDEAFERMFERDKADLREIGVPLESGLGTFDETIGYRIARRDYALPDIHLEPDEAAAVGLAVRQWRSARFADAAARAKLKLTAIAPTEETHVFAGLEPHLHADPALPALTAAAANRQVVEFAYRRTDQSEPQTRTVHPYGVLSWHGHWYVVGFDPDRDDTRVFRLSRITGDVRLASAPDAFEPPAEFDLPAQVRHIAGEAGPQTARLRVRVDKAFDLRRIARHTSSYDAEWDVITISYVDAEWLADEIAGYGADVVVLEPQEARAAIVARLRAVAGSAA